jgi:hypothetical protein
MNTIAIDGSGGVEDWEAILIRPFSQQNPADRDYAERDADILLEFVESRISAVTMTEFAVKYLEKYGKWKSPNVRQRLTTVVFGKAGIK